ncbi:EcoKI restriction-modification system protein HsdS [Serratia quinivorans]|uniref:restriction endonuclease subunit S n=1 Tax=Serratia quinivorans TaxID=137545 RepID=UPI0021781627|nr:restriction endonuclease subunit S [Serratia quinivorans]CAI1960009.1 EcoKI restriction-modification system protein HsdS [Serratia quinivorans]
MVVEKLITEHIDTWTSALKTRSTAGRGSNGKIDLYGIKKLRELILELAVRGKLVPQDPNDEPASELLKRIAAEKAELVKQGKIKKQKPLPEIGEDEKPFELPIGWEWVRFGEVLISRDADRVPLSSDERLKRPGIFDYYGASGVIDNIDDYIFDKPLLLIGEDGANLVNRSTPIAFMAYGKYWVNNHAHVLDGHTEEFLDYICLYINAINLEMYVTGTAQPKMNQAKMNTILIGLPSELEQNRIVSKVKELMSLCGQLEQQSLSSLEAHSQLVETLLATLTNNQNAEELAESWARISQHFDTLFTTEASIDALKQTILQLAVMGKLVPQDPTDEPASELLKRIEQEKAQLVKEGKIKKQKSLPPISEEEKPFELPSGWEWRRLADIAYVFSGSTFKSENFNNESGAKCIKITNVGVNDFAHTNDYLPVDFLNIYSDSLVRCGDLLLAMTRPYISDGLKVCVCPNLYDRSLLNQRVCAIRPYHKSSFYYKYMSSETVLNIYQSRFNNSGLQPNLKMNDITELLIPVPPTAEQDRIITTIGMMSEICDQLKSRLQSAQQTQLYLADALTDAALN